MFRVFSDINKVIKDKKIKVEYPKGYKHWKTRFEQEYTKTKSVSGALDNIHGKKEEDT